VDSIGEVFAIPRFSETCAALIRCTHIEHGLNQMWLKQNRTGIWNKSSREASLQTIIVLIDANDVINSGVVEVWAGRFECFQKSPEHAPKGFYKVDEFELVGLTNKKGLRSFCSGYCKGPNSAPVYLEANGNEALDLRLSSNRPFVNDFRPEFSGEKDVVLPGSFTADCVHGRVVTALYKRLKEQNPSRKFNNRNRFDLLMEEPDGTRVLFEVKTSHDSQSVYTGVGQLSMYNLLAGAHRKTLVLPQEGIIWRNRLQGVDTGLWTYGKEGETFQSPSHKYR